jgi:hypothetical protein
MQKIFAFALPAALALSAGLATAQSPDQSAASPSSPRGADVGAATDDGIVISGTVVSTGNGTLVLSTDDHRHRMRFDLGSAAGASELRRGQRVSVRYHATGATGQAVDEVRPLDRGQAPVSQASFRPVMGGGTDVQRAASMDDTVNARGEGVRSGQRAAQEAERSTAARPETASSREPQSGATDSTTSQGAAAGGELPATASGLPLTAASGLLLVVSGLALRLRRRSA